MLSFLYAERHHASDVSLNAVLMSNVMLSVSNAECCNAEICWAL